MEQPGEHALGRVRRPIVRRTNDLRNWSDAEQFR